MGPVLSSPHQSSSSAFVCRVQSRTTIVKPYFVSSITKTKMSPTVQPKTQLGQSLDFCTTPGFLSLSTSKDPFSPTKSLSFPHKIHHLNIRGVTKQGFVRQLDDDAPMWVELQPINSETQFYRVVAEAQQLEEPLIIVWMASWCRKCIYLKPKLQKLAADYYQRLQFYYVDVNTVSHKLVAHAGVTKMPTIQLWKDGKKQDEVIGGHKAYLVVNDVRQMIENASTI